MHDVVGSPCSYGSDQLNRIRSCVILRPSSADMSIRVTRPQRRWNFVVNGPSRCVVKPNSPHASARRHATPATERMARDVADMLRAADAAALPKNRTRGASHRNYTCRFANLDCERVPFAKTVAPSRRATHEPRPAVCGLDHRSRLAAATRRAAGVRFLRRRGYREAFNRPSNGSLTQPRRGPVGPRQSGAPLAATNVKTAGCVCKRRDAVRLGRKEGLQPRASERPAVGCSEKLAGVVRIDADSRQGLTNSRPFRSW
jgi:hypothetical protein